MARRGWLELGRGFYKEKEKKGTRKRKKKERGRIGRPRVSVSARTEEREIERNWDLWVLFRSNW